MPSLHVADVDPFSKIAALVTVCSYVFLMLARGRITSQEDDESSGDSFGRALIVVSIVGLAGVLAGALLSPHLM